MAEATGPTPFWSLRSRMVASAPPSSSASSPLRNRCERPTTSASSSATPIPVLAETGTIPTLRLKSLTRSNRSAEIPNSTRDSEIA